MFVLICFLFSSSLGVVHRWWSTRVLRQKFYDSFCNVRRIAAYFCLRVVLKRRSP